ncbi:MAG: hypothetical protein AAF126_03095 [Chloroflexota bacterium]
MSEQQKDTPQANEQVEPAVKPDTQQGQQSEDYGDPQMLHLTPSQLKQRLDRAQSSALSGVLETLGVESIDSLKATLDADRQRREKEMSETEKLQAKLDSMQAQLTEAENRAEAIKQQRLSDVRDNGLMQMLDTAYDRDSALILIKAKHTDAVSALVSDDGVFDKSKAKELIETFKSQNAVLFQSSAPGTRSNQGGRIPNPENKKLEQIRKEIKQKRGKW